MAEILGIVASSIQLADAALKIGDNIYKFVDNIRSAPKKVKTFRGDLDQTLSLLKDTRSSLEIAKTKYNNLGDTAKLVENTLEDFNRELAEISITVETLWARSQSWRVKIKIGFKGDSEWVRIDARIRVQCTRLAAASVQLSNKLVLENGERLNDIGGSVTAIDIEITQNVSKPIQNIQNDVQNIRTTGDTSIQLIQESMALQLSHMNRVEKLHGEQFQRVTEVRDTVVFNQFQNTQAFDRIEDTCQTLSGQLLQTSEAIAQADAKLESVSDRLDQLELNQRNGQDLPPLELAALYKLALPTGIANAQPTSKTERIRLEVQRKKMTGLIRRIIKLADGSTGVKLMKGDEAEKYTTTIQELVDTLQDESEIGNILKQEISKVTLQLLGSNSLYMQKGYDSRIKDRLERKANEGESMMVELEASAVEHKQVRTEHAVEDGTVVISSRYRRRVAASPFGEDDEMESSRTIIQYNPKVAPGETRTAFAALFSNTSGTLGSSSVPLLLRVYHRRDYDIWDQNSPTSLASKGKLDKVKELLSSGQISIYDTDKNGMSLLHEAVSTICARNKTEEGLAPGCFALCQFLLDHGADANIIDDFGKTPLSYLALTVFEQHPEYLNVEIARSVFNQVLDSGIKNRSSPFGPEQAIARLIRSFMAGSTWFFDQLLTKINDTEFDINNYAGSYNAIMLEFAAVPSQNDPILFRNYDMAMKRGGDICARTWNTGESCLHLLLYKISCNEDDLFIKNEATWKSFKKHQCNAFKNRLNKMLSLGADVYATDRIFREFVDGTSYGRSVTRAMYEYEVQDIWWETILEFGFEKETIMRKEAEEIGVSVIDYEAHLEGLAKASFEARQEGFERRRLNPVANEWMVPDKAPPEC
ncbi:hypothetical protein TWF225_003634 [Orbilia oligospora]|nr:hypothetical protein TWF225_003634 [Orbilia oligospora]KAF3262041.1 hypothetical protein TWF128_002732 [Orbilia oligospora]KAF3266745.1 hypothetical protein TWF217_001524 [Orbilia oligospora]KAF3292198.1 hypothetical protein TWF132_005867 [Orbilia oligospora]